MFEFLSGGLGVIVIIFLLVLSLLWFLLPFAIFGTKDLLLTIIQESKKTNEELLRISSELAALRAEIATERARRSN